MILGHTGTSTPERLAQKKNWQKYVRIRIYLGVLMTSLENLKAAILKGIIAESRAEHERMEFELEAQDVQAQYAANTTGYLAQVERSCTK